LIILVFLNNNQDAIVSRLSNSQSTLIFSVISMVSILFEVAMNELNFNYSKRVAINFAIFLLLYETTVYIANDMIMPGMLNVVKEFHSSDHIVSTSLTAFIFGGASLQIFLGPLSDRFGRRPVLIFGAAFFVLSTIFLGMSQATNQFLIARFFQGMGLCFITVVGYATLQEIYTEISAVRLITIMNSVTILAPLFGPLLGALIIQFFQWRIIFLVIAIFAIIALLGIWKFMPETVGIEKLDGTLNSSTPINGTILKRNYLALLNNKRFMIGSLSIAFASVPIIAWIGTGPLILMKAAKMTVIEYALWQIPIFLSAIFSNIIVRYLINHITLNKISKLGSFITLFSFNNHYIAIVVAISFYAFGLSFVTTTLNRSTLYSTIVPKGTAAAMMSVVLMLITATGNNLANLLYNAGGNFYFSLYCAACGVVYFTLFLAGEYIRIKALDTNFNFSFNVLLR
jgi:DHA1 family multidrug/chloramphenicol efflux transport protein-like MFS transporter